MKPRLKDLPKLHTDLEKMEEFRRYAERFGGHIRLGGELVSIETIDELIEHLKFQIAAAESVRPGLQIIPKQPQGTK